MTHISFYDPTNPVTSSTNEEEYFLGNVHPASVHWFIWQHLNWRPFVFSRTCQILVVFRWTFHSALHYFASRKYQLAVYLQGGRAMRSKKMRQWFIWSYIKRQASWLVNKELEINTDGVWHDNNFAIPSQNDEFPILRLQTLQSYFPVAWSKRVYRASLTICNICPPREKTGKVQGNQKSASEDLRSTRMQFEDRQIAIT